MDFWTLKYVRTDLQKSSFWEEKYWISKMFKSEWGIETNRDRYCTLQSASQKRRTKHLPVSTDRLQQGHPTSFYRKTTPKNKTYWSYDVALWL